MITLENICRCVWCSLSLYETEGYSNHYTVCMLNCIGFKSLKAGESEVYHLGYFVDEDQVENMSLNFYGSGKNHSVLRYFE